MGLKTDLTNKIDSYFNEKLEVKETKIVPSTDYSQLTFGNKVVLAELCFLFVDIRESSKLHEIYGIADAVRIYESFHDICVRVIESMNGEIRAFDGDRVMGVFSGDYKCTNATKAAMKIKWAIVNILNKKLDKDIAVGLGIDYGDTIITKIGKGRNPNNQDLVWVGEPCNHASHLSNLGSNETIISSRVHHKIHHEAKISSEGKNMWTQKIITLKDDKKVTTFISRWGWAIN